MAILEFVLRAAPIDIAVYTFARSFTQESTMQLRKRVAAGKPLVEFDTDNFPLAAERAEHYHQILSTVNKMAACECEFQLFYRVSPGDENEQISREQLAGLLNADLVYEEQDRD